jgi:hypothetical protein
MNKQHMGSSIDDFMKEEGIFEEVQAQAMKEVATWKSEVSITRRDMAENEAELNEPTAKQTIEAVTGLTVGFARARFAADDRQSAIAASASVGSVKENTGISRSTPASV